MQNFGDCIQFDLKVELQQVEKPDRVHTTEEVFSKLLVNIAAGVAPRTRQARRLAVYFTSRGHSLSNSFIRRSLHLVTYQRDYEDRPLNTHQRGR